MDKNTFDERVKKIKEVDKIIKALDPTIRESSFKLLLSYITGGKVGSDKNDNNGGTKDLGDDLSREDFFTKFDHDKPADNVLLITAYLYSQYGNANFSLNEIRELADDVGVTIPARIDMTLKMASRDNKYLFTSASRNKYNPTVHGEKCFKESYGVKKGRLKKEEDNTWPLLNLLPLLIKAHIKTVF